MSPRKRKRLQQSQETDYGNDNGIIDNVNATTEAIEQPTNDRLEKECEVWEAFREEHFEAIEQLPLTLHRQYALMHELDQQANGISADLLPMLQKYILKRREMNLSSVSKPRDNVSATHEEVDSDGKSATSLHLTHVDPSDGVHSQAAPLSNGLNKATQRLPSEAWATLQTIPDDGLTNRLNNPITTRETLSHIALLTEELLRASEEKVNIAKAAYDSVDRHCRILEQAIKDQESSIALGPRPGHLAPNSISDLILSRSTGRLRATLSPLDGGELEPGVVPTEEQENAAPISDVEQDAHNFTEGKRGRGRRKGRVQKQDEYLAQAVPLTITLPAQPVTAAAAAEEETYCYCNQGSFGEMIACDDKKCVRGWYHLKCVDLDMAPEGRWYCPDCQPKHRRRRK
ncbi:PHD finger protein ING1 [Hypsizygus marmoreus]|uniref:Chromatin modification-related protein n=1 Tax=Hypsizygus marmoreus TaxID=39966 RepID=A0A369JH56_HYPMA|nr:PHD finger protein ING1 [Hypsizygus marmoreus]